MRVRTFISRKERKEEARKLFEDLLKRHKYLLIVDASGLRARLLSEIRRLSREYNFVIRGGKNGVFLKAAKIVSEELFNELKDRIEGQNIFIFTDEDIINLALKLNELEVDLPASPGDVATKDIIIPAGNTGIPPGPVIGLFSALGLQTRIVSGTIHIMKETVAAKEGERISMHLANLLSKLGIYPIKAKVNFKFGYDMEDKIYYSIDTLLPDIDEIREMLSDAARRSYYLALGIEYPEPEILSVLLLRAYLNAKSVAVEAGYITEETLPLMISKAISIAKALKTATSS
jgi:large subunit ribosomal protein L10